MADRAIVFDLDGTLVDLRAAYVRAHQLAAVEVLAIELSEKRVLDLMATGMPIRAHMALLDEGSVDRLVEVLSATTASNVMDLPDRFPESRSYSKAFERRGTRLR